MASASPTISKYEIFKSQFQQGQRHGSIDARTPLGVIRIKTAPFGTYAPKNDADTTEAIVTQTRPVGIIRSFILIFVQGVFAMPSVVLDPYLGWTLWPALGRGRVISDGHLCLEYTSFPVGFQRLML